MAWAISFSILSEHYPEILAGIACFTMIFSWFRSSSALPYNFPVLGMLPGLLYNLHRLHDYLTYYLRRSGFTLTFKGPLLLNMEFLVTCDPLNVNHIFNVNFHNYPKGQEFNEIFDIFGDGLFNADDDSWRSQRKMGQLIFSDGNFRSVQAKNIQNKVEKGLIPFLDSMASKQDTFDLQDVCMKLTFDTSCLTILGVDPQSLLVESHAVPFSKAIDDALDALVMRHLVPPILWKVMRRLRIGSEKKLALACDVIDRFILEQICKRRDVKSSTGTTGSYDMMTAYMSRNIDDEKFLRDTALTFVIAGRGTIAVTLVWFFYALSKNPIVESRILDELRSIQASERREGTVFDAGTLQTAVYLHAALCEALRLYPAIPIEHKSALKADVLPSGHRISAGSKIIFSLYAMGRMKGIWGDDCLEFKPERWISESGQLRHEPSYKFLAFNCGPRTCLGRDVALVQMKIIASTLIYNFHFDAVDGHAVIPKNNVELHMKNGMMVRVKRRHGHI